MSISRTIVAQISQCIPGKSCVEWSRAGLAARFWRTLAYLVSGLLLACEEAGLLSATCVGSGERHVLQLMLDVWLDLALARRLIAICSRQ